MDSNSNVKMPAVCIPVQYLVDSPSFYTIHRPELRTREYNVFKFGCLYYEVSYCFPICQYCITIPQIYFDVDIDPRHSGREETTDVAARPTHPQIHDDVWSLIQRCCAEDRKSRPTMDEIVMEIESWSF